MSKEIRMQVPAKVAATSHYVAQVLGCPVREVYAAMLFAMVSSEVQMEILDTVRDYLPRYRAALVYDRYHPDEKGGE